MNSAASFTTLVRPYLDRLYRLAYRLTGHREDAQDLLQDVLLKVHSDRDRLAATDSPGAWLSRVLYNQFVDNRRRYLRRRLNVVADPAAAIDAAAAPHATSSPEAALQSELDIRRLQTALEQLSDDHRLVINLHDVEGYTLTEIAEITGIPLGTLKSRRQRARERLQKLLR